MAEFLGTLHMQPGTLINQIHKWLYILSSVTWAAKNSITPIHPLARSSWMPHPCRSGPIISSSAAILPPFLICSYAKPQLVQSWININQSCVKHMNRKKQTTHTLAITGVQYMHIISNTTGLEGCFSTCFSYRMVNPLWALENSTVYFSIAQDANWQNDSSNVTHFAGIQLVWVITMARCVVWWRWSLELFQWCWTTLLFNNFTVSGGNAK